MTKARELAELGAVYDSGALSNRNFIINGAMAVTQRGTSSTGIDYGYHTADRMRSSYNGSTSTIYQNVDETVQTSQSVDGSTVNVLKRTYPTNSDTGEHRLNYRIELDDIRPHLGKTLTLSYYAKADVALTLDVISFSLGGNSSTFTQAITTSWQRYSHTFTCSSTVGSSTFADLLIGATASNFSNTSVYYTMLQLEVGSEATPFEHRSYGDELARCQRYYWQTWPIGTSTSTDITGDDDFGVCMAGNSSKIVSGGATYPVTMRARPSVSVRSASGTALKYYERHTDTDFTFSSSAIHPGTSSILLHEYDGSAAAGREGSVHIFCDAEL